MRHQKIRGKSKSIFNQRTERQGQFDSAFFVAEDNFLKETL